MELSETGLIQLVKAAAGKQSDGEVLGSIPSQTPNVQAEVAAAIQKQLPKVLSQIALNAKKPRLVEQTPEQLNDLYSEEATNKDKATTAKLGEPVIDEERQQAADELATEQGKVADLTSQNGELDATNNKLKQELSTVKEQLALEKDATASANEHAEMLVQQLDEKKQVIVANQKQLKELQAKIADLEAGNDEQLRQQTDELENYKQKARSLVTFAHNLLKQIDPNAAFIISMPAFNELDAKTRDYLTAAFNTEINDTDANRLVLGGKVDQKEAITNDSLDGLIKTAQSGIDGGSTDDTNFNAENTANNDSNQQAGNGFDETDKKPDENDPDNY